MRTNLTKPAETLVGRQTERGALLDMLREGSRVVTITGPAGAGKTRLALDVALALVADGLRREIWRCDLGEARDLAGLCDAVAQAIGATGQGRAETPAARVGLALEARGDVLLLLDEMELVAGLAGPTLAQWLATAPDATFLITSREPLRIAEETVVELGALPLPPSDAEAVGDAVELFVRCARRARPGYSPSAAEAPFVAALVRELDGLPLAIELCAPRMAVMGARALLHRMTSRFELLRRKGARPGDRHATLAAAIDASLQTLTPEELAALSQCAVFRAGFALEAAEAVVDLGPHPNPPAVLDVLQTLREKSLLHADVATFPGELRLAMLASVRAYVWEKLDPGARAAVHARHAHHVVRTAEEHAAQLTGKDGPEHRARILAERDNLTAVIERVLGQGPVTARTAEPALRALLVLATLSPHDGPLATYVRALDPVLAATRDSGADPVLSARALLARGTLLLSRGDVREGSSDLVQALAVARTLGDASLEARCTHALGHALAGRGDVTSARDHFQRAIDSFARLGEAGESASATASLAELALRLGRLDEAEALARRALAIHRAAKNPLGEAADLCALGRIAADRDDLGAARAHLDASLGAARSLRDRRSEGLARGWLGFALQLAGLHEEARAAYEAASAALGELGLVPAEALFAGLLGVLLRERGAPAEAFARLSFASERMADGGDDAHLALFLAHAAALEAEVGRDDEARALGDRAAKLLVRASDAGIAAVLELGRARREPAREQQALTTARALEPTSAQVRIALRCQPLPRADADPIAAAPAEALLIGPAGLWFRAPHGERVALDRRQKLAGMLDRLATERLTRPGNAIGWDVLLAAAWPGERVSPDAAAHRVRVAVSTLRKLGLRDVLRTSDEGYAILPEVETFRMV